MRAVVSGNIGRFTLNQELTDDKDIAEYFRTILNEGEMDTTLTDEQILDAVKKHGGESLTDDDEIEIVMMLEEDAEDDEAA